MRLLLDTHIFIWCVRDDPKLTKKVRSKILSANDVFVSSASIWEAAIKIQLKKLQVSLEELVNSIEESGFKELAITSRHALTVANLPLFHRDPFDRILIAQAISEPLTFITVDGSLKEYSELVEVVA